MNVLRDDAAFPPLGRRARKALAVRNALFEAGLAAFERQPISLVSILDITDRADVAKGVFYLQFRSKDSYLLALWEEVQRRFLEALRAEVPGRRSRTGRIEAAVGHHAVFTRSSRAAARFWVRMSSYFADEVGEPGELARLRQAYIRQLAAIIAAQPERKLSSRDVRMAQVLDSICWGVAGTEARTGEPLSDTRNLVNAVLAAMTLPRPGPGP